MCQSETETGCVSTDSFTSLTLLRLPQDPSPHMMDTKKNDPLMNDFLKVELPFESVLQRKAQKLGKNLPTTSVLARTDHWICNSKDKVHMNYGNKVQ